jgi:anti-anti-sigma factor
VPGEPAPLGFPISPAAGAAVVGVPAEVDWRNAEQLRQAVESAATGSPVVVADLRANRFCDSSGIAALVMGAKQVEAGGGELRLVLDGTAVQRIFKLTGVDRRFRIFASVPDALSGCAP